MVGEERRQNETMITEIVNKAGGRKEEEKEKQK